MAGASSDVLKAHLVVRISVHKLHNDTAVLGCLSVKGSEGRGSELHWDNDSV
jgi:hypothetical protein